MMNNIKSLRFAIEQYIKYRTQIMIWVYQENEAAPGSDEYYMALYMRENLEGAQVKYHGDIIDMMNIVDYTLEHVLTDEEYDTVIEEFGSESNLYKKMHDEAIKRANMIDTEVN